MQPDAGVQSIIGGSPVSEPSKLPCPPVPPPKLPATAEPETSNVEPQTPKRRTLLKRCWMGLNTGEPPMILCSQFGDRSDIWVESITGSSGQLRFVQDS